MWITVEKLWIEGGACGQLDNFVKSLLMNSPPHLGGHFTIRQYILKRPFPQVIHIIHGDNSSTLSDFIPTNRVDKKSPKKHLSNRIYRDGSDA